MDEVLLVRGLRKRFESEATPVRALRGVELELTRGEFVAVMGPSGCGKSTLLNLIAGVDTPSGGEIVLAGLRVSDMAEDQRARAWSRVSSRAHSAGPRRPALAIARALVDEPTLLLADEPTGALDSAGGPEVLELLRRLHERGPTILLVTHDHRVAEAAGWDPLVSTAGG